MTCCVLKPVSLLGGGTGLGDRMYAGSGRSWFAQSRTDGRGVRLREVAGDEGSRAFSGQEFLFWEPQSAFCVAQPGQVFEKVGREHP